MIQQSALWWDQSWNPVSGCDPVSEGCKNCWAERMARRLAGRCGYPEAPDHFNVTLHPDRLDQPLRWKKSRRVFVSSMGDLFHKDVPFHFIEQIFYMMAKANQHTYQLLTKRPQRMLEVVRQIEDTQHDRFDDLFPNVWLGVTAENQERADERIPILLQTPAAVRFVSVEPMLGPVDMWDGNSEAWPLAESGLDWIIIGCESGPNRRPIKLEWAVDVIRKCKPAGVPVFVKQLDINGKVSKNPTEWPEELRVREYP